MSRTITSWRPMSQALNAVMYARSKTDDVHDLQSILDQFRRLRKYADHHGLRVVDAFVDIGESANNMRRAGLRGLLQRCRQAPHVHVVLVSAADRLARRLPDCWRLLNTFETLNVQVHPLPREGNRGV